MRQTQRVTYGKGGFDTSKPNGNVVDTETETVADVPAVAGVDWAAVQQIATSAPSAGQIPAALQAIAKVLVASGPLTTTPN